MYTDTIKTAESKKLQNEKSYRIYLKHLISAASGFLFSAARLPAGISPFACAFLSSADSELSLSAFFGSTLSCFIFFPLETALRYLLSLSLCLVLRLVLLKRLKCESSIYPSAVVCTASLLCGSCAFLSFSAFDITSVLVCILESMLSFICVIIYKKAFCVPLHITGLHKLSPKESFYLLFTLSSFLLSFSSFTLGGISPARIISVVLLLFLSQYKGILISSVSGVLAGLSFSLVPSFSFLFPFYALSSSVSGLFSSLGQYAVSLSFALTSFFVCLFNGMDSAKLFPLFEAVIGAVIYSAIPIAKISLLQSRLDEVSLKESNEAETAVSRSLRLTAQKLEAVSEIAEDVSSRLDKIINPEINKVFTALQQSLCFGCSKKKDCWSKYFNETANDIMIISGIRPPVSEKTNLEHRCLKPNALLRHINNHYGDFVSSVNTKMKISEMRTAVSDQLLCVSEFLFELSEKWNIPPKENEGRSRSIISVLKDRGIEPLSLKYMTAPNLPVRIEAEFYEGLDELDFDKIKNILELTALCKFKKPQIDLSPEGTKIIFTQKHTYKLIYGFSQIPLSDSKICGDSITRTTDESGNEIIILSDGMGTGARASVDATMTARLFEKLLSCGFSFESAVKAVNSSLIMKSTDESLATVDALSINLYSGKADFNKAGAAVSFIRHGNGVKVIDLPSMPIGILRTVNTAKAEERLSEGDIILLVSDGVTAGDCGWINDEICAWSTNNMDDLASHIASLSKMRSNSFTEDDISVIALKLLKADL